MFSINKIIVILICLLCLQTVDAQWQKVNTGNFAWFKSVYFINQNKDKVKFIIAPHNIKKEQIKELKNAISKKVVLFSEKETIIFSENSMVVFYLS